MLPERFLHSDPKMKVSSFYHGLTTIHVNYMLNSITIQYRGNMGNTIDNVKKSFDGCFGPGSWRKAEKTCTKMNEEGSPDYFYFRFMEFN